MGGDEVVARGVDLLVSSSSHFSRISLMSTDQILRRRYQLDIGPYVHPWDPIGYCHPPPSPRSRRPRPSRRDKGETRR